VANLALVYSSLMLKVFHAVCWYIFLRRFYCKLVLNFYSVRAYLWTKLIIFQQMWCEFISAAERIKCLQQDLNPYVKGFKCAIDKLVYKSLLEQWVCFQPTIDWRSRHHKVATMDIRFTDAVAPVQIGEKQTRSRICVRQSPGRSFCNPGR